ncbi:MAG TPA: OmpA family protein [Steroidobacteraceae bacterium]|nr:OmpA family protein [Steroidobacteraceae bacterium]
MKHLTLRAAALGFALSGSLALSAARAAEPPDPPGSGSKQSDIGVLTGLAVGAAAGGPVGALVGSAAGALLGDRYHRQAQSRAALAEQLERSELQRAELQAHVAQLDGSLSQARERSDELAAELGHTDQLGLDVSFRTDDDSVAAAAMSPLLKLGALAASLPQAQLSVAGFTDPRGSEEYNQELSLRRAQNVAAVLESAGVPAARIRIEAHGKSAAASADGDLDSYALERRVTVRMQLPGEGEVARRD